MHQKHSLSTGTLLKNGDYRLETLLGQGGFGITYKATQISLGRIVVVKEFFMDGRCTRMSDGNSVGIQSIGESDYETYKDRFFEEARMLAQFGNLPGIVKVIDFFRENNTVYYVMDFVEGDTLQQYLLRQPEERLSPTEAAELICRVALALAPVHDRNVLHRDLKPANIIRQPNGEPVVLDFGAARAFISDRTAVHSVILTPGYAPPEQYSGTGKYGPPMDVYALGAVLYRLLTGQTPLSSPNRILEDLATPHDCTLGVPRWLSDVTMKAMALKPEDRYASMSQLAGALKSGAGSLPPPLAPPAVPPVRELSTTVHTVVDNDHPATATQQATVVIPPTPSPRPPHSSAPTPSPRPPHSPAPAPAPRPAQSSSPLPGQAPRPSTKPKNGNGIWMAIGAVSLVAIVGIIWLVSTMGGASPEKVAIDFAVAIDKGDFKNAKVHGTESTANLLEMVEPMLASMGDEIKQEMGMANFEKATCEGSDDRKNCKVCCDDKGNEMDLVLVKQNGKWLVDMNKEDMNKDENTEGSDDLEEGW